MEIVSAKDNVFRGRLLSLLLLKLSINFIIQFHKSGLCFIIKTIQADLECLIFLAKDRICLDDMNKTTYLDWSYL